MSVTFNISSFNSVTFPGGSSGTSSRLQAAILVSVVLHAAVLLGVNFELPLPKNEKVAMPLQVVLVTSKPLPPPVPEKADVATQVKPDGERAIEPSHHVRVPAPPPSRHLYPAEAGTAEEEAEEEAVGMVGQDTEQPEREANHLMTATSDQSTYEAGFFKSDMEHGREIFDSTGLVQRSFEIARLGARATRDQVAYQKPAQRKYVGARIPEYRFARYVEDWRIKVERVGNLNYPEAARREKLYGSLRLTVGIKADGSLESVELNRPSGKKVLDEAAVRIVKLAGQNGFAPFPPDISRDTDILHITRTWVFTRADELASE